MHLGCSVDIAVDGLDPYREVPARSEFGLDQGFELYDDDFEGPSRPATEYQGQILDWLEEHRDKRFFLWVHYFTPHTPNRPSADFDRLADQLGPLRDLVVLGDAPERELDEETLRRLRALGYAQ